MKKVLRVVLAIAMIAVGVMHFVRPEPFIKIVPAFLPSPRALVLISGVFEVLGGAGLLLERTRRFASLGLVALYVAVFPANINMAIHQINIGDSPMPTWAPWVRLPFQVLFIAWAYWVGRPEKAEKNAL